MDFLTAGLPAMIIEYSVGPIKKYTSYVFGFRSKVNALSSEVRNLEVEKQSLHRAIEDALRRGEEVETYVCRWETRAEEAIREAEALVDEEAERAYSVTLCLNLKTRYRIGKKAEKGCSGIIQLREEKGKFGPISRTPDLQQIVRLPVQGYEAESRAKILKEVMDALLDPNITIVGVHGMGGIGKTTLVKEVHRLSTQNKLFDKVIIVRVTVTPDLNRIQDEIAEFIVGSKLQESSDSARASSLSQKLKDRRILIILDDLWSELDLDEGVGIPTDGNSNGCKILLTSRKLDLLSKMHSHKNFNVQLLSKEESMSLFEKEVAEIKYREIAEKILVKCAGFPLMIVTIAGLLRDKELHVWNDILAQVSKFDNQEIQEKVYSMLELSYNHLPDDNEAKQIFLLCGICSNNTLLNLLRYSCGLGLFKHYTVSEAKDHLRTLIDYLKSCSLLDADKLGNVKMHDTIRDAAITIARRDQHAFREKDGNVLNKWPSKDDLNSCTKVSIPYSNIQQFPEDLGCPQVEFMLLFSNRSTLFHIPNSTFQRTRQLKVVHFTRMRIASMPSSLCFLIDLHTLCLEDCHLSNVANIGHLKNLEILSFHGSSLEALPIEIGHLTKLKLLDLSYCFELCSIPANVISKLTSLEELLMRNRFGNWEIEEHKSGNNARLSELKCLSQLASLEIRVPNAKAFPKGLFSNPLERYQILIGKDWDFDEDSETTKTLKMKLNTSSNLLQQVKELLKELEALHLDEITGFTNLLHANKGFPRLKKLHIRNSVEIQHIVGYETQVRTVCFPLLEYLKLYELKSLVSICHGRLAPESFRKIKRLEISACDKLKNLFSLSMLRSLSQLEEIEVRSCHGMEALFIEESECNYDGNEVEFPRLRRLNLGNLPQLKCFLRVRESPSESCRSSETKIADKLILFFSEKVALSGLENLILDSIGNIQTIWCNQVAPGSLSQLRSLEVKACAKLEEIVTSEECLGNLSCFLFPQIASLTLEDLPQLRNLYPNSHTFGWPNLKSLTVRGCDKAKIFVSYGELQTTEGVGQPHFPDQTQPFFAPEKVLPNLEKISVDGGISKSISTSCLKYLTRLKSLELSSVRGKLVEVCEFESIPSLRDIVARDSHIRELWSVFDQKDASIRALELENVKGLRHVWRQGSQMDPFLPYLEILKLKRCGDLISLAVSPSASFGNLSTLVLEKCHKVMELMKPSTAKTMLNLVTLTIRNCDALKEVIAAEGQHEGDDLETWDECIVFNKLKILNLYRLESIEGFCTSSRHSFNFPCLEDVSIYNCPSMRIFCHGDIITPKVDNIHCRGYGWQSEGDLNNIVRIFHESLQAKLQSVRKLRVSRFPELVEKWGQQLPFKLSSRLHELVVDKCALTIAIPSNVLQSLSTLRKLAVEECDFVEEIFDLDGMDQNEDCVGLMSQLQSLELIDLPKLRHVWNEDPLGILGFKNLRALKVHNCRNLMYIFSLPIALSLVHLNTLEVKECALVEVVIKQEEDERSAYWNQRSLFPSLESMELENLANLMGFNSGDDAMRCPALNRVSVIGCPKLSLFGSTCSRKE